MKKTPAKVGNKISGLSTPATSCKLTAKINTMAEFKKLIKWQK